MRSLSPSRTFTCTLTVSPDLIAGRSVSCVFSTISIAPISQLLQNLFLFIVQCGAVQQIRPPRQRPAQRFAFPPPPDRAVIPRTQNVGPGQIPPGVLYAARPCPLLLTWSPVREPDRRRTRVLRKVQQSARERVFGHRALIADDAGDQPRDGVEN